MYFSNQMQNILSIFVVWVAQKFVYFFIFIFFKSLFKMDKIKC